MNPQSRPNILIIHTDQHRYDCLGAYGNTDIQTPRIDALAADGVLYHNSFCAYPVCTPSRYSLLSGLYVHQHLGRSNRCTLPSGLPTFPRLLRDSGYRTKAVGKMHFTPTYLDVGFREMLLCEQDGPGRFDDDYHRWLRDHGVADRWDLLDQRAEYRAEAGTAYWDSFGASRSDLDERHHSTTWIAERAVEELSRWTPGRNLLMVGFVKPHHPFDPPAPWDTKYDPDALEPLPGWLDAPLDGDLTRHGGYFPHEDLTLPALQKVMAMYYATISQIDFQVGRMIDCLRTRGLYENTLIVYTSDHGDYLGFHHLLLKGNHLYDPVSKVPLILKLPGGPAGESRSELVSNVDIAPTLLRAAGLEVPDVMSGHDLASQDPPRQVVFAESDGPPGTGRQYMARSGRAKLLLGPSTETTHFFDLEADPLEIDDRSADPACSDEIRNLRDALSRWILFEAPAPVHLDEDAPVISGENQPADPDASARELEAYFRDHMADWHG
jgi:arylsulfatase A-like enzyme